MKQFKKLDQEITEDKITIGILGLGYVGLPLAVIFALKGIKTLGFEKSEEKIRNLNEKKNYISDISEEDFQKVVSSDKFGATADFSRISECQVLIICVPTPLDKFKKPDMSYIKSAAEEIGKFMKPGTFISLESTTYPTTTEDFMLPILLEKSGLKYDEDFWICFSPERVDPGNADFNTQNTPKVLGGLGENAQRLGEKIYSKVIDTVHSVSSPRIAEMVKLLENTYRLVNISMINELALLCGKMDIDIWEVIEAAKTKPFGFQAFYPGPGIGGHCIPLDPFYLEYIAKNFDFDLTMIHAAGHINTLMAHRMTIKITSALNRQRKPVNGSKILFLGVAYKPNIDDERESPALKIIEDVMKKGGIVNYHDPYIDEIETDHGHKLISKTLNKQLLNDQDCIVITTNHKKFDIDFIIEHSALIVDLRNAIKNRSEKIYKL
jgi:UDP-N-acetyl-D-glucosamine dehydrogenase